VYAKEMTEDEIAQVYDDIKSRKEREGKPLNRGEIGCALSHFKVYQKIIDENLPYALIFEDDACIDKSFLKIYHKLSKKTPKSFSWEYLLGNYTIFDKKGSKDYIHYLKTTYQKRINIYIKLYLLMIGASCVDYLLEKMGKLFGPMIMKRFKPLYLMAGYFITNKGAKKLLSVHPKVFLPSDILPEWSRKKVDLKMYAIVPLLIKQDSAFETNI
jgi:glycosyl transferase family 25